MKSCVPILRTGMIFVIILIRDFHIPPCESFYVPKLSAETGAKQ